MKEEKIQEFIQAYKAGQKVEVDFIKANGEKRHMVCQRDNEAREMEAAVVHGAPKKPGLIRVVEITEDGTHQWRSIVLDRIVNIEI